MAISKEMVSVLIENLHFPKTALFNRVIAKENFFKNLDSHQRAVIVDDVQQINWVFLLKSDTTNIHGYENEEIIINEIDVIHIQMKRGGDGELVSKLVMSAIPKPVFLVVEWNDDSEIMFATGSYKRIKSKDNSVKMTSFHKTTQIKVNDSEKLFTYIDFDNQRHLTLNDLLNSWIDNIERYVFEIKNGSNNKIDDYTEANDRIVQLERQIQKLTKDAKKETQLNKRAKLVSIVKVLQQELTYIKNGE